MGSVRFFVLPAASPVAAKYFGRVGGKEMDGGGDGGQIRLCTNLKRIQIFAKKVKKVKKENNEKGELKILKIKINR